MPQHGLGVGVLGIGGWVGGGGFDTHAIILPRGRRGGQAKIRRYDGVGRASGPGHTRTWDGQEPSTPFVLPFVSCPPAVRRRQQTDCAQGLAPKRVEQAADKLFYPPAKKVHKPDSGRAIVGEVGRDRPRRVHMATPQVGTVVHRLRRAVLRLDDAGRTDGQLLASFVEQKDAAAFEALLHRHAAMVFGVCRRVVGNHHDAEDAFQATFLVLARKSGSVRPRDRLASWLHGVALRTAMKARTLAAKRRGREQQVIPMPEPAGNRHDPWTDLQPVLDQELNGLPENYRLPILLCDLEGKTIKEATEQLGWPQGTFASRLVRGRKLLARRLTSRGITLSGGALALVVCRHAASAAMPASLMSSTVKAAALAAGQAALAGVVPAKVALLTEGVLKTMLWSKLKTLTATFLVLSLPLVGGGLWTTRSAIAQQAAPPAQAKPQPPAPPAAKIDPVARLMELAAFYEQTGHPKTAAFYRQLAADAQKKAGDGQRPPLPVAPKAEVERQYAITARLLEG